MRVRLTKLALGMLKRFTLRCFVTRNMTIYLQIRDDSVSPLLPAAGEDRIEQLGADELMERSEIATVAACTAAQINGL
jgi:hypothetical protein